MAALIGSVAISQINPPPEIVSFVTLAGEDFSEFAARAPGVFCFIGAGKPGQEHFPHHHPQFDIDEDALQTGLALLVKGALAFFEKADQLGCLKKGT
jgi:amidohydrolase